MSGYIYFFRRGAGGTVKIGFSKKPMHRLKQVQTGSSDELRCIAIVIGGRADEGALHEKFAEHRISGEWFAPAEEILVYAREHGVPLTSEGETAFGREDCANMNWLMSQAAAMTDRDGMRRTGLTDKGVQNIRQGKSKPGFDGLVSWCRSDPFFAAASAAYVGLISPDDVEFEGARG